MYHINPVVISVNIVAGKKLSAHLDIILLWMFNVMFHYMYSIYIH